MVQWPMEPDRDRLDDGLGSDDDEADPVVAGENESRGRYRGGRSSAWDEPSE